MNIQDEFSRVIKGMVMVGIESATFVVSKPVINRMDFIEDYITDIETSSKDEFKVRYLGKDITFKIK